MHFQHSSYTQPHCNPHLFHEEHTHHMRRIVVTPVGRRRYVELLYRHLLAQRDSLDQWHLWMNTNNQDDINYMRGLAAQHPDWILCRESVIPYAGNLSIYPFFNQCTDHGCVYLRIDDDIVWMEPGFLNKMFTFRLANPEFFLVYANIVNNAVVAHLHQRMGNIDMRNGFLTYDCFDPIAWESPHFAEHLHRSFIEAVKNGSWDQSWHFDKWILRKYERVSINCISWLGSEFSKFRGCVGPDEERWLSCDKPSEMNVANVINGGAICAHFSFYTQREHLDRTDVLGLYETISPK